MPHTLYYRLTVTVPDLRTFEAYDYGYGQATGFEDGLNGTVTVTVLYSKDRKYNAECQRDRFHSGLYFARLEEG